MSTEVTGVIRVSGLAKVDEQLAALGGPDGTRILRRSMLRAAVPILDRARQNVAAIEHGSGALNKSLGMRFLYGRQKRAAAFVPPMGGNFRVQVMPFANDRTAIALYSLYYKRPVKRLTYGHLIEFGFHRGKTKVRAQPFLKPALDTQGGNALAIFRREMDEGIAKQLKRNARKTTKT